MKVTEYHKYNWREKAWSACATPRLLRGTSGPYHSLNWIAVHIREDCSSGFILRTRSDLKLLEIRMRRRIINVFER
jgi:hypothetical protein